MPFKHNAARRHRIPTARYRVQNWREYEAGLQQRGDLTLWLDEAAITGWQAPRRTTPGGQAWYSDAAIELVIDSTGLKLFGQGEWDAEKHGRARRSWRKLHIAVDADRRDRRLRGGG